MVQSAIEFTDERSILGALGMEVDQKRGGIAYLVISGRYGPRWIIPNEPTADGLSRVGTLQQGWKGSVDGYAGCGSDRPAAFSARGTGKLRLLREPGSRDHHSPHADPVLPLILVGNPSVHCKVILLMADARGELVAVEKYPPAQRAREAIQCESRC
jgi:hypothetical protein